MPEILEWSNGAPPGTAVVRIAQALAGGQLVPSPPGTSYAPAAGPPPPVRERLPAQALLVPASRGHEAVLQFLQSFRAPVLCTPVPGHGEPEATPAEASVRTLGDRPALIIDAGPTRYGRPATRVRVD